MRNGKAIFIYWVHALCTELLKVLDTLENFECFHIQPSQQYLNVNIISLILEMKNLRIRSWVLHSLGRRDTEIQYYFNLGWQFLHCVSTRILSLIIQCSMLWSLFSNWRLVGEWCLKEETGWKWKFEAWREVWLISCVWCFGRLDYLQVLCSNGSSILVQISYESVLWVILRILSLKS